MSESPPQESAPRPWWVWCNVLGLDAVITALLWMPLLGKAAGRAKLVPAEYVVLGCAVWCVYAADRILDGRMKGGMRGERHVFAARMWMPLAAGIVIAAGVSGYLLAYEIREIVTSWGLRLMAGVAVYFGVTWFSRQQWTGLVGAASLGGLMAVGLMQGTTTGLIWPQIWRGAMAGFLVTVLYLSVRRPGTPAPWTLPRKLFGGWLFAMGTALAPHAHLEMRMELVTGSPVLLFGAVCGLNSLGIRLWEKSRSDYENSVLTALYPWLLITTLAGAVLEWAAADDWSRPALTACGISSALLLLIHLNRGRLSAAVCRGLADAALIVAALIMLPLVFR